MKWLTRTKLGKVILVFGVLLLAVGVWVAGVHSSATNSVDAYKRQLTAAGEKLTIAELIPPRVSTNQNSAEFYLRAAEAVQLPQSVLDTNPPPAMRIVGPGKAKVGWQQPDVRNEVATNTWEEIEWALLRPVGALNLPVVEQPILDFELDYRKGFKLVTLHLFRLKRYTAFLGSAAVYELHQGDTASAVTNARTILSIAKGLKDERLPPSQYVRMSMTSIGSTVAWELLQSPAVTDEQLAVLQRDFAELEFIQSLERALQMERAIALATLARMRTSNSPIGALAFYFGGGGGPAGSSGGSPGFEPLLDGAKNRAAETLWRISWSYEDELRELQGHQVMIDALRQVQTNGVFKDALAEKDRRLSALGLRPVPSRLERFWDKMDEAGLRRFFSGLIPVLDGSAEQIVRIEAVRHLTITAITLKRYQLRHRNYPASLEALVPEFLASVPRDPGDGLPLRYHLNPDGRFRLYSVGRNCIDDAGDTTPNIGTDRTTRWDRRRDIVWPQPATPAEVEAYEALPK